jgi:hypothetical protein
MDCQLTFEPFRGQLANQVYISTRRFYDYNVPSGNQEGPAKLQAEAESCPV